jgi:drug/metabolite transporter (DMT)-like permease
MTFLMAGVLLAPVKYIRPAQRACGRAGRDTWPDTLLKMATQGYFALGIACYGLSVFVWILGLSRVPVSVAYPLLSVGYVVNAVAAYFLFGETVSLTRWLGIGFIVIGVTLVARS